MGVLMALRSQMAKLVFTGGLEVNDRCRNRHAEAS